MVAEYFFSTYLFPSCAKKFDLASLDAILHFVILGGCIFGWLLFVFSAEMLTGRIAAFAVRQLPKTLSEVCNLQSLLLS